MANSAIEVRPIAGAIGAEVFGVDLGKEVDDATVAAIRKAWLDHNVVFLRDQDLPPARFLTFARRFGAVVATQRNPTSTPSAVARRSSSGSCFPAINVSR